VTVEQRAEFLLRGEHGQDVDLEGITHLIGVAPTKLWRAGEVLRSGRRHRRSIWWWETDDVADADSEAVIGVVLDTFTPRADAVREACRRWGVAAHVGLAVSMHGEHQTEEDGSIDVIVDKPGLSFGRETIERLATLGASFDVDQYVLIPTR
jgi:Domain of unknown function (DUF4279)